MRFIQTYVSGPLSRHTKWRSQTHPPAGNALVAEHEMISEVLQRASVSRPARRSQPEQAVPGDRGDVETQRARGADRGNGTLHGQASSQRECGDEPRFVTICGRPTCVGDLGAQGAPQGKGGASGKTKAEGGQVMPDLGKGTACIHTPAPQSGSLNGERGSHFRPSRDLLPLPLPEVLQISEDARSLSRPVRQRLL